MKPLYPYVIVRKHRQEQNSSGIVTETEESEVSDRGVVETVCEGVVLEAGQGVVFKEYGAYRLDEELVAVKVEDIIAVV